MTLVRWQPLRDIDTLQNQLNRLFDEVIDPIYSSEKQNFSVVPLAELSETPEAVHLKLEIPGIDAKDLDIQVTKDAISVSGERKQESKTEANGVTRSEFRYGKFKRVVSLPCEIQNDNVKAEYKDGILSLTLPKREEVKNQVVKVSVV